MVLKFLQILNYFSIISFLQQNILVIMKNDCPAFYMVLSFEKLQWLLAKLDQLSTCFALAYTCKS